jgi:hypothetical protein
MAAKRSPQIGALQSLLNADFVAAGDAGFELQGQAAGRN